MRLVDANVLLYAVNSDSDHHEESRTWLDGALSGRETVAFSWIVLLAFIRLSTKTGLFPRPLEVQQATRRVDAWLTAAPAVVVHPTPHHARVLADVLAQAGIRGNLVNDAHLAALAIEHRCGIVSYDHDFARFPDVDWATPATLI